MEIEAKNIGDYLGRAFIYRAVIDETEVVHQGITVFVSRTGTGDDGVGDLNLGYTDKDGEPKDFYLDGTERLTII